MRTVIKWSVMALVLVGVIAGATALYGVLSDKYDSGGLMAPKEFQNGGGNIGASGNEAALGDGQQTALENEAANGGENNTDGQVNSDNEENKPVDGDTSEQAEPKPEITMTAPNFTVLNNEGREVKLSEYVGKPIVLNFWATWCYYCKQEMPDFNEAYKNYGDVNFVMVNVTDGVHETVSSAKAYVENNGFEFDILFDTEGDAVDAYEVTGYPTTYFIDANGNVVAYATGMIDYETIVKGIEMIT
ncbi:MAG: TlpA family protein disulfide reductase [Clostridia bacterium]|nr:TlpA family protein disulfide reductase [Clostridia bacterium]